MKRLALIAIIYLLIMMPPLFAFSILQGDIDNSGNIDLKDAIISLQLFAGINVTIPVYVAADVNGDGKIGMAEVIYALQCLTRLRNNHSPILNVIGNKTVDEGVLLTFKISATDTDGDTPTYSATNLPSGALIDVKSGTFTWVPTFVQSGTYQVTFVAEDGYGGTDSETIIIRVNNINHAPVLNTIGNKTVDEKSPLIFTISATDIDHDTLAYSVSSLPAGAAFDPITRIFSWTPTYAQSGTYNVTFTATDTYMSSVSETIIIIINDKNPDAPTISNLYYSPTSVIFNQGNGTAVITGTINFIDTGGNVSALRFTSSAGANLTLPIPGMSGQTSGTIQGSLTVATDTLGKFTFEVWLVDSAGLSSNHLTGTFSVLYDDSATHWTQRASGTTAYLRRVAWSGTQYVAVGDSGTIITSPDGISWTQRSFGTTNGLFGIAWSGTEFVAVGAQGTILTSPDGVNWTQRNSGIPDSTLYDVEWSGTQFVAVGGEFRFPGNPAYNNTLILTSPDGITWTKRTSELTNRILYGITWSGAQFIAVSGSELYPADTIILSSSDGINWTQRTIVLDTPYTLFDIVWTGSQFVIVGTGGVVFTSSDGINWIISSTSAIISYGVTWSENNLVAVGWDINTSPDGVTWTRIHPIFYPDNTFWGIVWGGNQYVAVGDGGLVMTSP